VSLDESLPVLSIYSHIFVSILSSTYSPAICYLVVS
jgi:hypothetical protein